MADQYLDVVAVEQPATVDAVETKTDRILHDDDGTQPEPGEPTHRTPHDFLSSLKNHRSIYILVSSLIALTAVWLVAGKYETKFQFGNKLIATQQSDATLQQEITSIAQSYRLTITYPSGAPQSFSLSNIGLHVDTIATLQALRHQQAALLARFEWWKPIPVQLKLQTNIAMLNSFITNHVSMNTAPAKDASLTIVNGTVQLAAAVAGRQYGLNDPSQAIQAAARQLNTQPLVLKTIALSPTLTAAQLVGPEAIIKQLLQEHITISIGSQTVIPNSGDIASWLALTPDAAKKTVDIGVNSANIRNYMNGLGSSANRLVRDQVNISTGGAISVAVQGQDGLRVTGQQTAADTVSQNLLADKAFQINLPIVSVPYGSITAGDWAKWIEVNLSTKRMYVYQYGSVVNTFLVSAGKTSTPTPTGQFAIWDKLPIQTMRGPGYVQPNVPWINYFDHSGDAIHGNYWRAASVFGNVNTSHGCVGLQLAPAEWVYDWAPIGTPIIIHV